MSKDYNVTTRKFNLKVVGDQKEKDRVNKYLSDGMYAQNAAYNILISKVYSKLHEKGSTFADVDEILKKGSRKPKENDPDHSLSEYEGLHFPTGLSVPGCLGREVNADIKKNGLMKMDSSLPTRKIGCPLYVTYQNGKIFSFYHNYDSYDDLVDNLYNNKNVKIFMKFANNITFEVVFGNINKSRELRSVFEHIFDGTYGIGDSKIAIENPKSIYAENINNETNDTKKPKRQAKDKEITFYLSVKMPKKYIDLDENVVAGVDLGIKVPAMCALNTNSYIKESIGDIEDFLRVRTKINAERSRLQHSLKYSNGGHGRYKKMKAMDAFKNYEKNFATTYNHKVSKDVVDFAIKNKAKYINIENLEGFGNSDSGVEEKEYRKKSFFLRYWSYYQLQQFITYKAEQNGIIVRKVNPYYTSRRCSCCGNEDKNNRKSQENFVCTKCGKKMNADFNAARNIAMSTDFSDGKKTKKENKKTA